MHFDCPYEPLTKMTLDILATFNLTQSVLAPTHTKGHIIDWLVHRSDDKLVQSTTVSTTISTDHFCVMASLNVAVPRPRPVVISSRNIRAIDRTVFKDDLRQRLAGLLSPSAADLHSALRDILDAHAPATQRKVSSHKLSAPWFSTEIRAAKQQRRQAERQWVKSGLTVHKQLFNKAKKYVTKIVHTTKTAFYSAKIVEGSSSRELFSVCNQLLGKTKSSLLPTIYSAAELPTRFLQFFESKIHSIRESLDNQSPSSPPVTERSFHGDPLSTFHIVSEEAVRKVILNASHTTCELDPIPTPLLIECLDILLPTITSVVNDSLVSGSFPAIFKSALVKPLLKKPSLDPNDLKNFRPVSNLTFLSKVIERIVLNQLLEHLFSHNLLHPLQSAYRSNHSTETALLKIVNDLLISLDKGKVCFLTLIDLSAAFDTVDHSILLTRLQNTFGISDSALSWFHSYISSRQQTVFVNGLSSTTSSVSYGVPQGSVLGPILFVLYMQPLFDIVSFHSINQHAFADDNQLYIDATLDQLQPTIESFQNCISDVKSWMTLNKLQLNDSKTECMLVRSSRIPADALPSSLKVGDCDVEFVPSVKNLGVTLDCHLTMSAHVRNTCKIAYMHLRQISAIRHLLTQEATQTLVCAFILSRLDYCNSLLSGCPKYLLDQLQRVQNSAARLIFKVKKSVHISPFLQSLHWLPISTRIQYKNSCLSFNSVSTQTPQYLSQLLQIYTPSRQLRSSEDTRILKIPPVKSKTFGQRSFMYQAPITWNMLPFEVRHSNSATAFRTNLKTHLFTQSYSNLSHLP